MRIDIVDKKSSWEARQIYEALKEKVESRFIHPKQLSYHMEGKNLQIYYKKKEYNPPDLVYFRSRAQASQFFMQALTLKKANVLPSRLVKHTKFAEMVMLAQHNIRYPRTVCGGDNTVSLVDFSPVVCKPNEGSQGVGIYKRSSIRSPKGFDYLLQAYIENRREDIRVLVLNGKVLGAIKRKARAPHWKTNVSKGAKPIAYKASPAVKRLAKKAAKAVGTYFAGVDIVEGPDKKLYVIEVNSRPGFIGFMEATKMDVPGIVAKHLVKVAGGR